ncbi:hypothetical protein Gpo141_00014483 [Globisporangium polare]
MRYSALAGTFAAVAGMLGKFGADGETSAMQSLQTLCGASQQQQEGHAAASLLLSCAMIAAVVRVASIALMLASNAVMLNFFVKGLHETDSLTATVTSASVNFMLSAAGGHLLFHEHLPLQWFVGATLILAGMGCLLHGDSANSAASSHTTDTATKAKQS